MNLDLATIKSDEEKATLWALLGLMFRLISFCYNEQILIKMKKLEITNCNELSKMYLKLCISFKVTW
jgi:hypothetical protein